MSITSWGDVIALLIALALGIFEISLIRENLRTLGHSHLIEGREQYLAAAWMFLLGVATILGAKWIAVLMMTLAVTGITISAAAWYQRRSVTKKG